MIIVKFSGGLGNQLYQYAVYRLLSETYQNIKVKADLSDYVLYDVHHGFELDRIFGVQEKGLLTEASFTEQLRVRGEMPMVITGKLGKILEVPAAWLNHKLRLRKAQRGELNVIEELPAEEVTSVDMVEERATQLYRQLMSLDATKDWYIRGFWQQECYLEKQLPKIRTELCFPVYHNSEDQKLVERLGEDESVSVHVRCGDYIGSVYQVLNDEYYSAAMELIAQQIRHPRYYIFSDDPERAKDLIGNRDGITYMQGHQGADSWRDMQLMAACKHHILANSSFSTWAAYLRESNGGMVIYPSKATTFEETGKRSGAQWIRIDVS